MEASIAAGRMLCLKLLRNRTHASDSITGTVQLRGLELTCGGRNDASKK